MKRILVCCGGGTKGLPQAMALDALALMAGNDLPSRVDLLAGTSIGGIDALLASVGKSATPFFTVYGPHIFRRSLWRHWPLYAAPVLEEVLRSRFNGATLDDCRTKVLVTAFDKTHQRPFMFKSYERSNLLQPTRTPLWQVARATSAAQRYFKAYQYGTRQMQDGGNVANNPAVCALADAVNLWGKDEPCKVLALGCGASTVSVPAWPVWLQELLLTIGAQFDTGAEEVEYQMRQFLGDNYREVQPRFASPVQLDSADPRSLAVLHEAGVSMVAAARADFEWFLS